MKCLVLLATVLFSFGIVHALELNRSFVGSDDRYLRTWTRHKVDNAFCGDGTPYHIFISEGDPKKIGFMFMGGGACWSRETCQGGNPRAILFPVSYPPEKGGFVSKNSEISPSYDFTMIYFPYCTGDVHLGKHQANYDGKIVNHLGASNVEAVLHQIESDGKIKFSDVKKLILYGYSAGAIGALVNSVQFEKYFNNTVDKSIIADSPGLHFGNRFWKKFSASLIADYADAMKKVDIFLNLNDGFIAQSLPNLCNRLSTWKILFLQSTHDIVMSEIFGEISKDDHAALVLGDGGLKKSASIAGDNCEAWIPQSSSHTYLISTPTSLIEKSEHKSAADFVLGQLSGNE